MDMTSEIPSSQSKVEASGPSELSRKMDRWAEKVDGLLDKLPLGFGDDVTEEIMDAAQGIGRQTKKFTQAAVLTTTLFAACVNPAFAETPVVTPTPTIITVESGIKKPDIRKNRVTIKQLGPVQTEELQSGELPESQPKPARETENPITSSSQEQETPQSLGVSGYLESDKENPSFEKSKVFISRRYFRR